MPATASINATMNRVRLPCSPGQRRAWVLDRLRPGNPSLNIAVRWRLEGRVSNADLARAFARLIERHASLRTFFAEEDGEPVRIVAPSLAVNIPNIDLTGLSDQAAFAEADRIAKLEARAVFDLSVAPLIRVTHLRVREQLSIVLVTAHQLICDAWSLGILAREMGTLCESLATGGPTESSELPTHDDYLEGNSPRRSDLALQDDEKFWTRALQGSKYFELHPDRTRPPVQDSDGDLVSLLLDDDIGRSLQELSERCGCSLFMTTLATLFVLLQRYSGESDVVIGTQVADRVDANLQGVVGPFMNTILQRGDLSGDPTFIELLARVRTAVVDSSEHRGAGLDRLIEVLKPQRDLSRNPLFSINFMFQRALVKTAHYGNFTLVDLPSCPTGALYDLDFSMVEQADGWRASCEYDTDLFEPETASRMLRHFTNLLRAAATDPTQRISAMPMLDEAERHTLIVERNRTDADYPRHLSLPRLFEAQVQRTPDSPALICGDQSLSYRELDLASNRLAHELQSRGIGRSMRVGICLDRSSDLVVALLAVLKAGAAYVPLDPGYPVARLAQIAEDARTAVVLTKRALRGRLPAGAAAAIELDSEAAAIRLQPEAALASTALPEDLAYVIFTSGSTGRPKGVQIQHRALINLLWSMRRRPGLGPADTLVSVTTVSFDIAALELFLPLIVGARLVLAQDGETADGGALLRLMRRHRATVMQATPVTWQILLAAGLRAGRRSGGRRPADPPLKMLCGGEALSRQLADQLLLQGGELWNLYGPTEATIWSSALRVEPDSGPVLIGPPIANTQFYELDPQGQLAPTGAPGELYIGGDGVAPGYLNLPEMSRERFVADTFRNIPGAKLYRTGDRVRLRNCGCIEFLGRADHQIKLRGFRIELGEIETVLRAHPQVADCVAIAAPDASGEPAIQAYVVPRDARSVQAATLVRNLQSSLQQALPAYMCPSSIIVLDALPRTPNGKLDRAGLPTSPPLQSTACDPTRSLSPLEQRLAQIWKQILGIPDVAADANFFEVGGHSLLAVRLLARIDIEFGRKLSLAALFKNPTIAEQANLLTHGDARTFNFQQVLKLQPQGSRQPLIAINNTGIYYALSKRLGPDQPFTSLQLFDTSDPTLPLGSLPQSLEDIAFEYVQLIRRVQPEGPYALLGWCVAGTLAFEVARQLSASEQRVSHLILFDAWVPGYLQRLPWYKAVLADYSFRWKLIVADWGKAKLGRNRVATFLANREIVKKLLRRWLRQSPVQGTPAAGPLSPEQYDQWLLHYLEDVASRYQPRPYTGSMMLFRSSEEPSGRFLDPLLGWGEFVAGGIEMAVIDGNHFSIFREPSVAQLALSIESSIDASTR